MGHLSRNDVGRIAGRHPAAQAEMGSRGARTDRVTADAPSGSRLLPSGLGLHVIDGIDSGDRPAPVDLRAGIGVLLMLEGALDAALADTPIIMDADRGPVGRLWSLSRPARFTRIAAPGRCARLVIATLPASRFDARIAAQDGGPMAPAVTALLEGDLPVKDWTPTPAAVRSADRLLAGRRESGILSALAAERDTLGLIHEALSALASQNPRTASRTMRSRDVLRAEMAREMILRGLDDDLHLPDIADRTGMSVSTLQRVFRDCYGQTVMEFARVSRLEAARDLLKRGGLSVGEASVRAGYSSPANFATAFHREFGYPPSQVRERARRAALADAD